MTAEPMLEVCWQRSCTASPEALLRHADGRLRLFRVPVVNARGHVEVYAESYSCAFHQPHVLIVDDGDSDALRKAVRALLELDPGH